MTTNDQSVKLCSLLGLLWPLTNRGFKLPIFVTIELHVPKLANTLQYMAAIVYGSLRSFVCFRFSEYFTTGKLQSDVLKRTTDESYQTRLAG